MSITVETSGPIDTPSSVIGPAASTFSDLFVQIANEIDDQTGEYAGEIQTACYAAIRYCERELFYFNETRDVTFVTVNGQQWYGAADNSNIPTLGAIHEAYLERSDGQRTTLRRGSPEDLELLSDNSASRGEPYTFTYFGQRIRLYPIPAEAVYTVRLQLGPYRLATITDSASSNAWTTEAFDMIKARAKFEIYKNIIKDAALAAEALNDYNDQNAALKQETSRRHSTGFIRVTVF